MSNFSYQTPETLSGTTYNIIGSILPDFGFPDKKMWGILKDTWPDENWDRGQVYDLYKWYQTGVKSGIPFYDVNTDNRAIFDWLKDNSPYTHDKINQWAAVFKRGIDENWLEAVYVGQGLAPEHEGRKIAGAIVDIKETVAWLPKGIDKLTVLALSGVGLIGAYYLLPVFTKAYKKRKS